ncbi:MAG: hypothetical protein CO093_09275 [Alphaproteobacteria bacterium CG_4_9_14_3_um_filter_47_13]|nr:MAG: hypothetical protein CO093_09275 [Alphaproteobacteria bacterium CG_4_9_14_3_um_filter_47_13]
MFLFISFGKLLSIFMKRLGFVRTLDLEIIFWPCVLFFARIVYRLEASGVFPQYVCSGIAFKTFNSVTKMALNKEIYKIREVIVFHNTILFDCDEFFFKTN